MTFEENDNRASGTSVLDFKYRAAYLRSFKNIILGHMWLTVYRCRWICDNKTINRENMQQDVHGHWQMHKIDN